MYVIMVKLGGNTRGKHNGNTDKEKEMISRYS